MNNRYDMKFSWNVFFSAMKVFFIFTIVFIIVGLFLYLTMANVGRYNSLLGITRPQLWGIGVAIGGILILPIGIIIGLAQMNNYVSVTPRGLSAKALGDTVAWQNIEYMYFGHYSKNPAAQYLMVKTFNNAQPTRITLAYLTGSCLNLSNAIEYFSQRQWFRRMPNRAPESRVLG